MPRVVFRWPKQVSISQRRPYSSATAASGQASSSHSVVATVTCVVRRARPAHRVAHQAHVHPRRHQRELRGAHPGRRLRRLVPALPPPAAGLAALVQVEAREDATGVEQRDVHERAERPVAQQDVAGAERRVHPRDLPGFVRQQRRRQQPHEHAAGRVEQAQELAHRVGHAGLCPRVDAEVLPQLRRVGRREAGPVDHRHARPQPRRVAAYVPFGPRPQRVDQPDDHAQRQPIPRLAVTARREAHAGELPQVRDRRVAVQDLDQEQPQRDQRRQEPLAPQVPAGAALLLDLPADEKIPAQRLAAEPGQRVRDRSHPWPPVGW